MSATNRGTVRVPQDLYETPEYAINAILDRVNLDAVCDSLEPCRASGRIYNKLPGQKYHAELSEGIDYLTANFSAVDLIITNPPFSLAAEFLSKSLLEGLTVIYLLRLNFLGSKKRKPLFDSNPLSHLYVLSKRPSFTGTGTDATEYAWFVWDRGNKMKDKAGIYVL